MSTARRARWPALPCANTSSAPPERSPARRSTDCSPARLSGRVRPEIGPVRPTMSPSRRKPSRHHHEEGNRSLSSLSRRLGSAREPCRHQCPGGDCRVCVRISVRLRRRLCREELRGVGGRCEPATSAISNWRPGTRQRLAAFYELVAPDLQAEAWAPSGLKSSTG